MLIELLFNLVLIWFITNVGRKALKNIFLDLVVVEIKKGVIFAPAIYQQRE